MFCFEEQQKNLCDGKARFFGTIKTSVENCKMFFFEQFRKFEMKIVTCIPFVGEFCLTQILGKYHACTTWYLDRDREAKLFSGKSFSPE